MLNSQSVLRNDVTLYCLARYVWRLFWVEFCVFLYNLGPWSDRTNLNLVWKTWLCEKELFSMLYGTTFSYSNDDFSVVIRERVGFHSVRLIPWIVEGAGNGVIAINWNLHIVEIPTLQACHAMPMLSALSDTDINRAIGDDRPSLAMTHMWHHTHVFVITHVWRRGILWWRILSYLPMVKNPEINSWVQIRIQIRIILEEDLAKGILLVKKSSQSVQ